LPGEYAPRVKSVITVGQMKQGVVEDLAFVQTVIRAHGGSVEPRATLLAGAYGVPALRVAATSTSRVARRYDALAHRGRVHVTFREVAANSGAIRLRPIAHGARGKG
jgi:hypothetical protein